MCCVFLFSKDKSVFPSCNSGFARIALYMETLFTSLFLPTLHWISFPHCANYGWSPRQSTHPLLSGRFCDCRWWQQILKTNGAKLPHFWKEPPPKFILKMNAMALHCINMQKCIPWHIVMVIVVKDTNTPVILCLPADFGMVVIVTNTINIIICSSQLRQESLLK